MSPDVPGVGVGSAGPTGPTGATGAVLNQVMAVPLIAVPLAVDMGGGVYVEVTVAAVATTMTIDCYLDGLIV